MTTETRILVVDDYDDTVEILALWLKRAGYHTVTASSAAEALEKARAERFDFVISDIAMPVMNGYELIAALREMPDYRRTPMIAVTGFAMLNDRDRSIKAGFNAHLTKPISAETLLHIVNRLLKK